MEYVISKELFEEVMDGCKFIKFYEEDYSRPDRINYTTNCNIIDGAYSDEDISINDFYFECKEWALKNKISLESRPRLFTGSGLCLIVGTTKTFEADSEQQAVFYACQWILENKDK